MQIARALHLKASPRAVWKILADDYAQVGSWARAVHQSAPNDGVRLPGAPVGGRTCTASIGEVTEKIELFDPDQMTLIYSAHAKSMPFFVRGLRGHWALQPAESGTRVNLEFNAELMPPFELLMGWAMRRQFRTAIDETLEDLKIYADTGAIHPEKAKALAAA